MKKSKSKPSLKETYMPNEEVDKSEHPTVVEYAIHTMMKKGKSPISAAKDTAKKLSGTENMFLGNGITVIDVKKLENALWERLVNFVIKNIPKMKEGMEHFTLDGTIQHFNQMKSKDAVRKELKNRVCSKLGRNPFINDDYKATQSKTVSEDKELGDIFAGEERYLPGPDNFEINTPQEKDLIKDLERHIHDTYHNISKTNVDLIQTFLAKSEYDDVIIPPTAEVEVLYRGLRFLDVRGKDGREEYFKFLEAIGFDRDKEAGNKSTRTINLDKHLKYRPNKNVSSWSKSHSVTYQFAQSPVGRVYPKIVLVAAPIDNQDKFFDLEMWYMKVSKDNYNEAEVIGLGEIDVFKIILSY